MARELVVQRTVHQRACLFLYLKLSKPTVVILTLVYIFYDAILVAPLFVNNVIFQERINLLGKMKNLEHELEVIREQLDEEYDAKQDLERQLSKALADVSIWKTRYETEGLAR